MLTNFPLTLKYRGKKNKEERKIYNFTMENYIQKKK